MVRVPCGKGHAACVSWTSVSPELWTSFPYKIFEAAWIGGLAHSILLPDSDLLAVTGTTGPRNLCYWNRC